MSASAAGGAAVTYLRSLRTVQKPGVRFTKVPAGGVGEVFAGGLGFW
jgi:hypothetical protein